MRHHSKSLAILAAISAMAPSVVLAASAERRVDIYARSLGSALDEISRQLGVDVLYGPDVVTSRPAPTVRGAMSPEAALSAVLEDTGLGYRRSAEGVYLIFVLPKRPEAEAPDIITTVPEILVEARTTQNTDIERRPDDIQPYQVWTAPEISRGIADTADDFLRTRVTANGQRGAAFTNSQASRGSVRSEVSLRGLSSDETLVLIDGRRLPRVPNNGDFFQANVNGVPLEAIERVEVLSATAGGIFGPGATGGAVNIVLKRDFNGLAASATYGASTRGDAPRYAIEGHAGHTFGRLRVMLEASRAHEDGLNAGDRSYTERARDKLLEVAPSQIRAMRPTSNAVNVFSQSGELLSLRPDLGGRSLGSSFTFAPLGSSDPATLIANAGKIGPGLSPDAEGSQASLTTGVTSSSVMANARLDLGGGAEAYLDAMHFAADGRMETSISDATISLAAGNPFNPFSQSVWLTAPLPVSAAQIRNRSTTSRGTAGLLVRLPHQWSAIVEGTEGESRLRYDLSGTSVSIYQAALTGDPFSPATISRQASASEVPQREFYSGRSRTREFSVRVAGRLAELPAGPATLSLLAENRREKLEPTTYTYQLYSEQLVIPLASGTSKAQSLYGELRAPLTGQDHERWWLRSIEAQLAVRQDWLRIRRISDPADGEIPARFRATAITAGLRASPHRDLILRASISTGALPPTLDQYQQRTYAYGGGLPVAIADPLRPGDKVAAGQYSAVTVGGGSPRSERARTVTAGIVVRPQVPGVLRLSLDYLRIDKSREIITDPILGMAYFVAQEKKIPGAVTRAPLTAADQALGYVAGPVIAIDMTGNNIGRTRIDSVDARADYSLPPTTFGDLHLSAAVSWEPRFERRVTDAINLAGLSDGPLEWRGNVGAELARGDFTVGVLGYYYGSYRVVRSQDTEAKIAEAEAFQGSRRIAGQAYFDLRATWRPQTRLDGLTLRLAIQNALDKRAPTIVSTNFDVLPFSPYGDPRGRRLEMTIGKRF